MIKEQETLNLAIQQHKSGNYQQAEALYKEILQYNPTNDSAWYFLGIMAYQLGSFDSAITCFNKAVEINQKTEYYRDLGNLLFDLNKKDEALVCYQKVVAANPADIDIHYNLGLIYQQMNRIDEAINSFNNVLNLSPNDVDALNILGTLYFNSRTNLNKALYCFERVVNIKPDFADGHFNLGLVYGVIKDFDKAIIEYKKALELNSQKVEFYINLGGAFQEKNELDEALKVYKSGLERFPDNSDLLFNIGCSLIKSGRLEEGWKHYEKRMDLYPHHKLRIPETAIPKWEGQDLTGKSLYLYNVAGIGDTLIFARYLPLIAEMGGNVYCEIQPSLHELFADSGLLKNINLINSIQDIESVHLDYQIPFMSLGNAFSSNADEIPFKDGYVKANPDKVAYYKEKYFTNDKFKLGVVWQASEIDSVRTLANVEYYYPFTKMNGIQVYSLQKGPGEVQLQNLPDDIKIIDLGSTFNNFADTAAAIESLDLVITVDTSVAHLAGALNKPVWVLIPFMSDWKWVINREDTIWYNSARLFRQKESRNWDEVMGRVLAQLQQLIVKTQIRQC